MEERDSAAQGNEAKADMTHIYGEPDPRAYFRELEKLDYMIPELARPIFRALVSALADQRGMPLHALDLGCSYGVNAALLKHDLSMRDLYARWGGEAIARAASDTVIQNDQGYFAGLPAAAQVEVTGLDPSEPAIAYGCEAGLLDQGLALNLEDEPLLAKVAGDLASVDLVMSTGCVGYVTERTFDQLLPAVTRENAPWIGNFVLRMFPFDEIAGSLEKWGYVTEKLDGRTFTQRDFVDANEQAGVIETLCAQGIDPAGHEADGRLVAEFYLSRPADQVDPPLAQLLAV